MVLTPRALLFSLPIVFTLAACQRKGSVVGDGTPDAAPRTTTSSAVVTPSAAPTADAATGPLRLQWTAHPEKANPALYDVAITLGAETFAIGTLDATTDEGEPVCVGAKKPGKRTTSTFTCGGARPSFDDFTAELKDGAVVIVKHSGADGEPTRTKEVKRVPTTATMLDVRSDRIAVAKAAKPACAKGTIEVDGTCLKECADERECAPGEFCDTVRSMTPDGRIGPVLGNACSK